MALLTLVQRIPEDAPLYIPGAFALSGIAKQDVGPLANGVDGMDSDIMLAAGGIASEPDVQAELASLVGGFDATTGDTLTVQVNQTGATLGSTTSAGDGALAAVDILVPPADPTAPPAPSPSPAPAPASHPHPEPDPDREPVDDYCKRYFDEDPLCHIR